MRRVSTVPATKIYPLNEKPRRELQIESPQEPEQSQPRKDLEPENLEFPLPDFCNQFRKPEFVLEDGQTRDTYMLPGYVRWNDGQFSAEQMRELLAVGAPSLPSPQIVHELVQNYLDWVHPQLPLLDLDKFLSTLSASNQASADRVSLLLLHAVLFAGALYTVDNCLPELGFDKSKDFQEQIRKCAQVCFK